MVDPTYKATTGAGYICSVDMLTLYVHSRIV